LSIEADDYIVRVDHLVEVDLADLREQFVGVEFGEAIIFVNPVDKFSEADAEGRRRAVAVGGVRSMMGWCRFKFGARRWCAFDDA